MNELFKISPVLNAQQNAIVPYKTKNEVNNALKNLIGGENAEDFYNLEPNIQVMAVTKYIDKVCQVMPILIREI